MVKNQYIYLRLSTVTCVMMALSSCTTTNHSKESTPIKQYSAKNALAYEGVYTGTLPCGDCNGLQTKLVLNQDNTFSYQQNYLDNSSKPQTTIETGSYRLKNNILTLPLADNNLRLLLGESALFYLDSHSQPYKGEMAKNYVLKKQQPFNFAGHYTTAKPNESLNRYHQNLTIYQQGQNYYVTFDASKVKDRSNCNFVGGAYKKDGSLWINISNEKNKSVLMFLTPNYHSTKYQNQPSLEVFTEHFDERFYMMRYCRGGGSLAGNYRKLMKAK